MKKKLLLVGLLAALSCAAAPKVIIDTDVGSSTDDLFAFELAAKFHKDGLFELAAVMIDRPGADNLAFTDAYLHYHGLDDVPIGTIEGTTAGQLVFVPYSTLVHTNDVSGKPVLPRATNRSGAVMDAVRLYRKLLAAAPDASIDICAIGFFTNLMRLLDTKPDEFSTLSGAELIAKKVRTLRIMAGSFDHSLDHPEYNVWGDVPSARRIFSSWPTPIVCTPYEVGVRVYYPCAEVREDFPAGHPIAWSYRFWDPDGERSKSQLMWDPMTVLGLADELKKFGFFSTSESGNVDVDVQGYTTFRAADGGCTSVQGISLGKAVRVRRWLRKFASGENRMPDIEKNSLRVAEVAPSPKEGPDGEFIVLTNLSSSLTLDLSGVRVVCAQPEQPVGMDVRLPTGTKIGPKGGLRLSRREHWPRGAIPNKAVNILIYGPNGGVWSEAFVDARWWNGACDGTGQHFVARALRPLVLNPDQWRPSGRQAEKIPRVVVLHTNDTHSHIDDASVKFSQIAVEKARIRATGENVVLADAGDYVQGTAFGGYDAGKSVVGIMSAAGYDVATIGNHEFDYGVAAMLENVKNASFRNTSCNLIHRRSADDPGSLVLPSYVVVTSGAARVAFVGVTTPTALVSAKPSTFLDPTGTYRAYDFYAGQRGEELYAAVQRAVDEAATKAHYVVVLAHLGLSAECSPYLSTDVIAHTTNFVAFIDGHSHSVVPGRRVKNAADKEVILAQTGCYLGALGCITLEDGRCVSASTLYPGRAREPEVEWLETRLMGAVERQLGTRLAIADTTLWSFKPNTSERLARSHDCAAGDFAADACWWYAREKAGLECDIALMNGGNVRADLPKGDVTLKSLRTMQPFANDIGIVEVDGRTILEALEFGAQVVGDGESGGFLQVAGLRYSIDTTVKSGVRVDPSGMWVGGPVDGRYRVRDVKVYDRASGTWKPLDPSKTYRVIGGGFTLVDAGDGFAMFKASKVVNNAVAVDYMVLADYVKAFGKGADGLPHVASAQSPLAHLANYPIAYENYAGARRIVIFGK